MSNYKWEPKLACIATYKVLEGDDNLDQFEEAEHPFDEAKDLKMEELRYYPKTTNNPDLIKLISFEIARRFVKILVKQYSVKKEKKEITSEKIITDIAGVFENKNKTVLELAEVVDGLIKFSDE
jgi:hypothetical protein